MNLLWITDPHLPFLQGTLRRQWEANIQNCDGLLLGGDLSEAPFLERQLEQLTGIFPKPIIFVTGNHDFYRGSITATRSMLAAFARSNPGVTIFEPGVETTPVRFPGSRVWLCGAGGWGDAKAGTGASSDLSLNDELVIRELSVAKARGALDQTLRALGDESAGYLQDQFRQVPDDAAAVVVLTHVPPWPESAWHEGRRSEARALPRFCCRSIGDAIRNEAARRPDTHFLVLCGHTHSGGVFQHENIICHTGASTYGEIHRNGRLEVGSKSVRLDRLDGVLQEDGALLR